MGARDLLIEMIGSLTPYTKKDADAEKIEEKEYDPENDAAQPNDDYMYDDTVLTRQAVISASQDYEKMCLIFSYINVKVEPEEVYVLDSNDKKYNAAFINPGEYGFVIPDVSLGDDITIMIKSKELDGTTVSQEEYDLYLKEQQQYKGDNLHVEDYEEETVEEDYDEEDKLDEAMNDISDALDSVDNPALKETVFNAMDKIKEGQ